MKESNPYKPGDLVHFLDKHLAGVQPSKRCEYEGTVIKTDDDVVFVEWGGGAKNDLGVHWRSLASGGIGLPEPAAS
jgi:hypothetical protein